MNHIQKTKTGLIWSFINQFGNQLISILVAVILTRLIDPKEFGLLGMVTVFINFASIFINFGFSSVLIHKDKILKEDLNTIFFCNVVVSLFLFILFYFSAPFIASFYNEQRLVSITRVSSISFLIAPIASVKPALLAKSMDFKSSTKISVVSLISGSLVALIMAFNGFGVWSIVLQILVRDLVSAIYFTWISEYKLTLKFNMASFKGMIGMGSSIAGDTLVNYWTRNADNLLVGKFLGDVSLGIYSRAYALMLLPLNNITRVIARVMLPSFSIIKNDFVELRRIYLRTIETIAAIVFPMMFGLSAISEIFVAVVFGAKWILMVPLIRVLAIVGAMQSILALNGSIYIARGKANLAFRITLVYNLIFLTSFIIGLYFGGLNGIAYAYFISSVIGAIPNLYLAVRLIKLSMLEIFKRLSKVIIASIIMALIILVFKDFIIDKSNIHLSIIYIIVFGITIFVLLIMGLKIKIYGELLSKILIKAKASFN